MVSSAPENRITLRKLTREGATELDMAAAFHATTEAEECERALDHLAEVIAMEGPGTIAAIVLESIPGTAGIMVPPPGYLSGVREICDRHGILLVADEVMSGFGRAGRWFAVEHDDVVPDLLTFAKGVNSGYVPLGGVVMRPWIADAFADRQFPGGLTYSGHPLATAAAVATIVLSKPRQRMGERGEIVDQLQVVEAELASLEVFPAKRDAPGLLRIEHELRARELAVPVIGERPLALVAEARLGDELVVGGAEARATPACLKQIEEPVERAGLRAVIGAA